jgi:HK97 family phage portal protein
VSIIGRLLPASERREWTPSWLNTVLGIVPRSGTWAGISVNERTALQQLTVWSCVSLISDTLSQLPAGAFRGEGADRRPAPTPQLLQSPTEGITWQEWIGTAGVSILLRGNTYGEIIDRDLRGFPTQILLHHPDFVEPVRDKDTGKVVYRLGDDRRLSRVDMWHVKGLTLPGAVWSLKGLSPIEYAANTIATALGAEEFGGNWFREGASPSGILATDGDLDEADALDMQERFIKAHGGRQRKPAVLGNGLKWQSISITAEESQFLQTIKAKREEIAGFYRIPPHMLGMVDKSTSWGSGIEEQMLGFLTFTMGIWLKRFEAALSAILPQPQYVKFNVAALNRTRLKEQLEAFKIEREIGTASIDEIRALMERAPLPDGKGEDYTQPLNWGAIPEGGLANAPVTPQPAAVTDDGDSDA